VAVGGAGFIALSFAAALVIAPMAANAADGDGTDPNTTDTSIVAGTGTPATDPALDTQADANTNADANVDTNTDANVDADADATTTDATTEVTDGEDADADADTTGEPQQAARVSNSSLQATATVGVIGELLPWTPATNNPSYWEDYGPHDDAMCYKHEANDQGISSSDHGSSDGKTVTLNTFQDSWPGDHWELLIIKGGSEFNNVIVHPEAGVAYASPNNAAGNQANVSHWIVCKGTTPPVVVTPTVTLTGVGQCVPADGTQSVLWTVTITGNGTLDEVDLKVIKHLPAGSLINGVDAQVWLTEWEEHYANHHLPAFPDGGVITFTQTNIPGSATSATAGIQYDFENGPSGDPETTITLDGNCTPPPTPKVCTTLEEGPTATDVNPLGWNSHDTRTTGVSEFVDGGYHLQTTDTVNPASSQNKATLYMNVTPTPLAEFGEPSVEFAAGGTGVKPGMQVGIDVDGDGDWDGYLVGEPWTYGAHNWWVNKPGFNVPSGMGYTSFGSWADFVAANPAAKVIEIGLSLGSGVLGDWVVTSYTFNCVVYTYDKVVEPPKTVHPTGFVPVENCGTANDGFNIPGATLVPDSQSESTDPNTGSVTKFSEYENADGYYVVEDKTTAGGVRSIKVAYYPYGNANVADPGVGDTYTVVEINGQKVAVWSYTFTNETCPTSTPTPTPTVTPTGGANTGENGPYPGATTFTEWNSENMGFLIGGGALLLLALFGGAVHVRKRIRTNGAVSGETL